MLLQLPLKISVQVRNLMALPISVYYYWLAGTGTVIPTLISLYCRTTVSCSHLTILNYLSTNTLHKELQYIWSTHPGRLKVACRYGSIALNVSVRVCPGSTIVGLLKCWWLLSLPINRFIPNPGKVGRPLTTWLEIQSQLLQSTCFSALGKDKEPRVQKIQKCLRML